MCVPEVIGKKGATIRKLRRASGCRVWVDRDFEAPEREGSGRGGVRNVRSGGFR